MITNHLKIWDEYFLARYDCKTDYPLGTYENINEAIKKVYGYDKFHPKYNSAKSAIIASYSQNKRLDGNRRTARGIWYKFEKVGK